jgi:ATP-dependent Lon protease
VFKKNKTQTDITDFLDEEDEVFENDEKAKMKSLEKGVYVVPLKDVVLFPKVVSPLFISRENSIATLEEAIKRKAKVVFVAQKDKSVVFPLSKDLFRVGVVANVLQFMKLPDGAVKVLVEGESIVNVTKYSALKGPFIRADVSPIEDIEEYDQKEKDFLIDSVVRSFSKLSKSRPEITEDSINSISSIKEDSLFINAVMLHLNLSIKDKQAILEQKNNVDRMEKLLMFLEREIYLQDIDVKIKDRVKSQIDKNQKEFYLNEQIKAIQKELGADEDEIDEYEKTLVGLKLDEHLEKNVKKEIHKLRKIPPMSAESTVVRNYLDWIFSLPWKKKSDLKNSLKEAKEILDREHYSLDKIKDRILEHLAVQNRTGKVKGNILCFVGPPGVGKTSLGKVIAEATGRDFARVALGGVKDESEIRGHRRTYIGAMPGRIIQSMKRAGSRNPLMLLDEIDKMGNDYRGDPSSALLEVLDPEQNNTFHDHYLDMDYDLSDVMFITTANSYDIPHALRDRMEIINLSGYTEDEKLNIVKNHLLPKKLADNGLKDSEFVMGDKAIRSIIRYYTREAGVRNLAREIDNIMRKVVKELDSYVASNIGDMFCPTFVEITEHNLDKYLGVKKFSYKSKEDDDLIGVVNGLAWTSVGGDMLSIEAISMAGKGNCILTGKLGDVMKESIQAAYSYVKANAKSLGLDEKKFEKMDVHVHVPEGATPKDGPSAGITMFTAIVSLLTGKAVKSDVAMTGEITLRGRVLPIGGLKEKLLAALRGGIKTVIIPKENEKDLAEIPENVKRDLNIIPISSVGEISEVAF